MILLLEGEEICQARENCSLFVKRPDGFFQKSTIAGVQEVSIAKPLASGSTNRLEQSSILKKILRKVLWHCNY